ncbi:hypothetical protein BOFE_08650 (plasmid) [Candidatus Borrelia fainii]|uniref:Antigen P35 n=1 Tax=Candidatus Borrelia fainii TaxID=2518322 RepID=A0ABM8DLC2_9SPIR|nr:complement regulator-acquiring protein [Candidatus Borrelia fainii]BDU63325.1 hypothetical protein BOFE_08650 [Candidatus Borrelia fainii]
MRNNILNNTFTTFALIAFILVGCNPNGTVAKTKPHTNSQTNTNKIDDTKKSIDITLRPQILNDSAQLAAKKGDDKSLEPKIDKKHVQNNLEEAKDVKSKEDNEKAALIAEIIKKVQTSIALINEYKNNIEDDDQYGMKLGVFNRFKNKENNELVNSAKNTIARRKFYSSLEWKKDTLKKFAITIKDLTDNLAITILLTGINYVQDYFEWLIYKINNKKNNLNTLKLQELKDIKNKLVKIEELRKKWRDTINNIITEYEADNDMQNNNQKLINHIHSKYGTIFKTEIPNIKVLTQDIKEILK